MSLAISPLFSGLFFLFFHALIYFMAVSGDGEVEPILPYVSDCCITYPSVAFFTLCVSISIITFVFNGLFRFFEILTIVENDFYLKSLKISTITKKEIIFYNSVSLILVIIISICSLVLGAFRYSETQGLHMIAGFISFIAIPFLYAIQTMISFHFAPKINTKFIAYFRLILTVLSLVFILSIVMFGVWSYSLFKKDWDNERHTWKPEDGGYVQHLIATSAEWLLILVVALFTMSYVPEFSRIKVIEVLKLQIQAIDETSLSTTN